MSTIQIISTCPLLSEFVPLAEYQASTPATFSLEETPVLYWHNTNCNASFEGNLPNLHDPKSDVQTDILVTSSRNIGYEIGYPCLTLHAIQSTRHSLYLQIEIDTELLEITIVPQNQSEVQGIYDALSQCSSLHPDIDSDPEDQYGGEPLEGDWITEDLENGDADDVVTTETNGFSHNKNPDTAGLAIEIEGNSQPGTRRTRDDTENAEEENEEDNIKWRKTN